MEKYSRGSEWRRWDLHVHTPASYLNNQFGDSNNNETWDNYVKNLFQKALKHKICAIGITDYFSIKGYKEVLNYQENDSKLKELKFSEEEIKQIKDILLLPNIELRLKTFVGRNRVNIHVIFSNEIPVNEIEENFLENLTIWFENDPNNQSYSYKLKENNLIKLGKKLISEQFSFENESPICIGAKNAVIDDNDLSDILNKALCFKNSYLIVTPVDEDLSELSWSGQDHHVRKLLYQKSNCFFASNENTIKFGLGLKHPNKNMFLKEFGSFKPCIHGCDAHCIDKIFEPDNNQYCWIKADPTFEGLKQILYEPEERIKISPINPQDKYDYFIIDSVTFNDSNFQLEPILLNENLNCIIGGKSTGKSILLQSIALSINKEITKAKLDEVTNSETLHFDNLKIKWKDDNQGENPFQANNDNRKIVYIPQTYLNQLTDKKKDEQKTQIDDWVLEFLLKNENIHSKYEDCNKGIQDIKETKDKLVIELMLVHNKIEQLKKDSMEIGNEKGIKLLIDRLQSEKNKICTNTQCTKENLEKYDNAQKKKNAIEIKIKEIENNIEIISNIDNLVIKNDINRNLSIDIKNNLSSKQDSILEEAKTKWNIIKKGIVDELTGIKEQNVLELKKYNETIAKIDPILKNDEILNKLSDKITEESIKLNLLKSINIKKQELIREKDTLIDKLIEIPNKFKQTYENFINYINSKILTNTEKLEFYTELKLKKFEFIEKGRQIYKISNSIIKELLDEDSNFNLIDKIKKMLEKTLDEEILVKSGNTKESAIRDILDDFYFVSYKVKMDGDETSVMSPGKKALVFLKLLIILSDSKCPILIDQPEDDLDNRSIYNDLVNFIKQKKKERQIILVTHNANIVIGADAEEVIIANQQGEDSLNKSAKFEYRSGSIENIYPQKDKYGHIEKGILNQKGIQQQICDILEGGEKAFELRKNKYHLEKE